MYLASQADVDAFSALNKGKQLQLSDELHIGKYQTDITSLAGLPEIKAVTGMVTLEYIKAADAPFLAKLTAACGLTIRSSGFTGLYFPQLQGFTGDLVFSNLEVSFCPLLTDLSFLNTVTLAAHRPGR